MKRLVGLPCITLLIFLLCSCSPQVDESTDMGTASTGSGEASSTDSTADSGEINTHLKILYWQAPSTLNPYLSGGTKDIEAASMVLEPLAQYDEEANMVPCLATEIPTRENGGISEDFSTITWNLKPEVVWSDGTPLTAEDVVFSWLYCSNDQVGCNSSNYFEDVESVIAVDDHTIRVEFTGPKPFPYGPFVGSLVPIIQKEQFKDCLGLKAQQCTEQNFGPIGTGPYKVSEFRANDVVSYVANELYREEGKPFFRTATLKGGGDAPSAARAVLETAEFDYAWNLQVEPEILDDMMKSEKGRVLSGFGSQVERIIINLTNDDPSQPDTRSQYLDGTNPHPFLSDFNVRKALSLAIDRSILVVTGYGPAGTPGCNVVPAPQEFVSEANESCQEQDIEEANRLLDEAGWVVGEDGVRAKNGVRLTILYQTSTNSVRQGTQALVKQMWQQIGVETELRNIDGSVFFGGDVASPDTYQKFFADVQMYTNNFDGNDPSNYMLGWQCEEIPGPDNQWVGGNISRVCSEEYDAKVALLSTEFDREKRVSLIKELNDMIIQNYWVIPLIHRARLSAVSNELKGVKLNGWDSELWKVEDWTR